MFYKNFYLCHKVYHPSTTIVNTGLIEYSCKCLEGILDFRVNGIKKNAYNIVEQNITPRGLCIVPILRYVGNFHYTFYYNGAKFYF